MVRHSSTSESSLSLPLSLSLCLNISQQATQRGGCTSAEEDPFSDELEIEEEIARLLQSGKQDDKLQDLDR